MLVGLRILNELIGPLRAISGQRFQRFPLVLDQSVLPFEFSPCQFALGPRRQKDGCANRRNGDSDHPIVHETARDQGLHKQNDPTERKNSEGRGRQAGKGCRRPGAKKP
jgi:hypothetical protein